LILGGVAAILLALSVAGGGLVHLFKRHVERSMADDLDLHLKQLLATLDVTPDGKISLAKEPRDPRFETPLSGLYWQISDDRGQVLRSRSLWDAALPLAADAISPGEEHLHVLHRFDYGEVLAAERSVLLTVNASRIPVRVELYARSHRCACHPWGLPDNGDDSSGKPWPSSPWHAQTRCGRYPRRPDRPS
jgi:hypothetical protein